MPGKVVSFAIQAGEKVSKGQALVQWNRVAGPPGPFEYAVTVLRDRIVPASTTPAMTGPAELSRLLSCLVEPRRVSPNFYKWIRLRQEGQTSMKRMKPSSSLQELGIRDV